MTWVDKAKLILFSGVGVSWVWGVGNLRLGTAGAVRGDGVVVVDDCCAFVPTSVDPLGDGNDDDDGGVGSGDLDCSEVSCANNAKLIGPVGWIAVAEWGDSGGDGGTFAWRGDADGVPSSTATPFVFGNTFPPPGERFSVPTIDDAVLRPESIIEAKRR